jgi:hypothetical protein
MDRRELLGALGVTAAGLVAVSGAEARAQEAGGRAGRDIHEQCAEACVNCEKECNQGFHHCYQQVTAGKQEHAKAMHLCVDCGDICGTSAKLVARMSPLMSYTCQACAECCDACIAECEKFQDAQMKETVEALRRCAKSCREMVQAMGSRVSSTR